MATRARVILPSPPPWHALPNALQKRERYEAGADYLADPLKILIADAPEVAVAEIVSGYIVTPRLNPAGRKEPHRACALRADSVLFPIIRVPVLMELNSSLCGLSETHLHRYDTYFTFYFLDPDLLCTQVHSHPA